MQITERHNPSFSVARATLGPGESIRAKSGAMMAMSPNITLDEAGLKEALKRSVRSGESLHITRATAGPQGGWIDFAPALPGDITTLDITPDSPLLIQKGSFLAADQDVEIDTKGGVAKNRFGRRGNFLLHATGSGKVVVSLYGAVDRFNLEPGEQVFVDTKHMVAFCESVTMELRKASESGWNTVKSGEGLAFVFTGPGELLMQSRNPDDMVDYVKAKLPNTSGGSGRSAGSGSMS